MAELEFPQGSVSVTKTVKVFGRPGCVKFCWQFIDSSHVIIDSLDSSPSNENTTLLSTFQDRDKHIIDVQQKFRNILSFE